MKRSYHTNLLINYKLGILEESKIKTIPNSTLYSWWQRNFSKIIGLPNVNDTEIDLMRELLSKKC